jgi:hypothetical protein
MTTHGFLFASILSILVLQAAATPAAAQPNSASRVKQKRTANGSAKSCRSDEEAFRVVRLTTVEGGKRVEFEFVRPGQATWTNMNRPLLRQFGVSVGATICLPRDPQSTDTSDLD